MLIHLSNGWRNGLDCTMKQNEVLSSSRRWRLKLVEIAVIYMTFFLKEISFYWSLIFSCPECQSIDSLCKCSDRSRYHVFTETESLSKHKLSRNNGLKCFNLGKKSIPIFHWTLLFWQKINRLKFKTFSQEFNFRGLLMYVFKENWEHT